MGKMMTKLTNMQLKILSQAAQREDGAAIAPERTGAASIRKTTDVLLDLKLAPEELAKSRMPIWRKTEDGRAMSLVILRAGRDIVASNDPDSRSGPPALTSSPTERERKSSPATITSIAQP